MTSVPLAASLRCAAGGLPRSWERGWGVPMESGRLRGLQEVARAGERQAPARIRHPDGREGARWARYRIEIALADPGLTAGCWPAGGGGTDDHRGPAEGG